jgi:putative phage-type endonuclease
MDPDFDRKTGLGGSDASAALGINPFDTAVTLYLKKVGEIPETETKEVMYWGNQLEDIVAREYAKRKDVNVRRNNRTIRHKEHEFMYAHLDRTIDGQDTILECKTAGAWMANEWGEDGTDQVPEQYLIQVNHYMICTGKRRAELAVLIGGNDFRMYEFEYDEELAEIIIEGETRFWHDHVLAKVAPDPQNPKDLDTLYAIANNEQLLAGNDLLGYHHELMKIKGELKVMEAGKDYMEYRIKKGMEFHSALLNDEGDAIATWKNAKDSRVFDQETFKAEHPDLFSKFKKTRPGSRRFLAKENKVPYLTLEVPNAAELTNEN